MPKAIVPNHIQRLQLPQRVNLLKVQVIQKPTEWPPVTECITEAALGESQLASVHLSLHAVEVNVGLQRGFLKQVLLLLGNAKLFGNSSNYMASARCQQTELLSSWSINHRLRFELLMR
jgi:hypothetical protein